MEKLHTDATVTTRCKLKKVNEVYAKLDPNHKKKLEESCFGSLLRLRDIKLASQVVHQLLLRVVKTSKKKEVWFKIGEKKARFGIEEFVLVTGLNAGGTTHVDKTSGVECRIVKEYFKKNKGKITKWDVYAAFLSCKKRKTDKYKLGLLVILAYVLWVPEENTYLDLWWFELVDDLDRFENYPWGKFCFEYTINVFKREMGTKVKNSDVGGNTRWRYSLHGFPLAIKIWAFEAIPSLGMKFAKKHENATPRMVAWTLPKRLTSIAIDKVLQSRELEVKTRLVPSEDEMEETYWKELTVDEEEDDNDPHQFEGDESEGDARKLFKNINFDNDINVVTLVDQTGTYIFKVTTLKSFGTISMSLQLKIPHCFIVAHNDIDIVIL